MKMRVESTQIRNSTPHLEELDFWMGSGILNLRELTNQKFIFFYPLYNHTNFKIQNLPSTLTQQRAF